MGGTHHRIWGPLTPWELVHEWEEIWRKRKINDWKKGGGVWVEKVHRAAIGRGLCGFPKVKHNSKKKGGKRGDGGQASREITLKEFRKSGGGIRGGLGNAWLWVRERCGVQSGRSRLKGKMKLGVDSVSNKKVSEATSY